jgi:hypothetical protein
MKTFIKITIPILLISSIIYFAPKEHSYAIEKAGCEAYLYISNNSLFECDLTVDGFGVGTLLVGKNKTYKVDLLNDAPKRIKVKVEWQDPDYIFPKSFYLLTQGKIECGQTDTMYISFTK